MRAALAISYLKGQVATAMTSEKAEVSLLFLKKRILKHLDPETLPIRSVILFGMVTQPDYDPELDEANWVIVCNTPADVEVVERKVEKLLDRLEDAYGALAATFCRSSTRKLIVPYEAITRASQWAEWGLRPEQVWILRRSAEVLVGEDLVSQFARPRSRAVRRSLDALEIHFPFEEVEALQRHDYELGSFLSELVLGFKSVSEERSSVGGIRSSVQKKYHIHRAELEEVLRIEMDAYLKRSRSRHLYLQAGGRLDGKTWFLSFAVIRARERGIPVRYFTEFDWQGLDEEEQLKLLARRMAPLSTRRWGIVIFDEVHPIINLEKAIKMIDEAGFMTLAAGGLGKVHLPKLDNLARVRFSDDPFRASLLIGHLRKRMQMAHIQPFKSPILSAIARATRNPFKASALVGGVLSERAWREQHGQPLETEKIIDAWLQRAPYPEFLEWCYYVADPESGLENRERAIERRKRWEFPQA
jgi:hypothetical protein